MRTCGTILAGLLLSGCVDRPPDPALVPASASIRTLESAGNAQPLVVVATTSCPAPTDTVSAHVSWVAPIQRGGLVEILILEPGSDQGKLWTRGPARGQASTPPWARAGMVFQLRHAATGEVFAEQVLHCR